MRTMFATVLRGLRSRALLSAGSVLLTALAVGSAVLAPIFQSAVTNSYLVTRLNEAPNELTGLSWVFQPSGAKANSDKAQQQARDGVAGTEGPFGDPTTSLETQRYPFLDNTGIALLLAASDACDHLAVEGACPQAPDEILMLAGDLERNLLKIGDPVTVEGPIGEVTVVGTYRAPSEEADFWFDLQRFSSIPAFTTAARNAQPYKPAPFITVPEAFDDLPASTWYVRVHELLEAPSDLTLTDLAVAQTTANALDEQGVPVEGGRLRADTFNDLDLIASETQEQQATARASITPAVISLVLVAMALLLRLLMAAADLRLPELALASLRGLGRRQLWSLGLSEPLALLGFSLPIGGVLGVGLSLGLVRWWLVPGLPLPLPVASIVSGLVVAVASVLVAILAVSLVLRVSLSEQLTGVRRPQASGRFTIILQLSMVAAAVAVLVSKLSVSEPGRPDVTDLVLPVLLAVVAGLAASRATSWLARWWTKRRPRGRSLPAFVASRAISRRTEGTLVILPVTAAIAICVFGAGVYDSAATWRASVAATTSPAGEVWTSPLPLRRTVALTHELDPDGNSLMAASTISTLGPTYVVIDTPRLARVGAWQDQWTPGIGPTEIAERLGLQADIPRVRGSRVGVTVNNRADVGGELHVRLRLDVLGGRPHYLYLGPFPEGKTTTLEGSTGFCRGGCSLDALTLGGPAALRVPINGLVQVSDLTVDGKPLRGGIDGAGWTVAPEASAGDLIAGVSDDGRTISIDTASGTAPVIVQLTAGALPKALPVIRGVDAPDGPQPGSFGATTSETEFPTESIAPGHSVPILGPSGVMIDYTMLTSDREIYPQEVPVYVFARSDTPEEIKDAMRDRGLFVSSTLAATERTLGQGAYALALRLYAVVALLVLLMALAGLFVSTAVQLPARRRDAASLRVVGVPRRSVMSAVLRELAAVLGATAVAGLAAGTLAQYVVLRTVTLGVVDSVRTPALVAAVDWQRLVLLALAAGLLFGAVALASAAMTVRGARGSTLRENAR